MKLSSIILSALLGLLVTGLFASMVILNKEYQKADKSDSYWNYTKILKQPFKYIKVDGGNNTNIVFEQNENCSVRVLSLWDGYKKDNTVKAYVNADTLYLQFLYRSVNLSDKDWLQNHVVIRVAAPELLSINGHNTNFEMDNLVQRTINVNLSGKSRFEAESNVRHFDTLSISQKDSSQVIFEMNPQMKGSATINADLLKVKLGGTSILDIGHVHANETQLAIADSSSALLSGKLIKKLKQ